MTPPKMDAVFVRMPENEFEAILARAAAPGQARADWRILCDVGRRMGWNEAFSYADSAEIFSEFAHLSGHAAALGRDFDISGLADLGATDYDALDPVQWPVPSEGTAQVTKNGRFFGDGGFYHADGKARMLPLAPPAVQFPTPGMLQINTGRIRDQWHTMTRTGLSARLGTHLAEPFAEIHPADAAALSLATGDIARLKAGNAHATLRVKITDAVQPGQIFMPMHWSGENAAAGRVNVLVSGAVDPVSGQPALKSGAV